MATILSHESRALVGSGPSLTNPNFYFPARHVLFYGDTGFGALPYFMPTFLLTGNPTLALNLLLLSCFAFSAASFHWVVARWTDSQIAGFVAAWTYLSTPWLLWRVVPTAPSYSVQQYLPWIVFLTAEPDHRWRPTLILAALVIAQCLTDVIYVAAAVLAPLALLALVRIGKRSTRTAGLRLLTALAVAVLVLSPVYAGHLAIRWENPNLSTQTVWILPEPVSSLTRGLFVIGPSAIPEIAWVVILLGGASYLLKARSHADRQRQYWKAAVFWLVVGLVISIVPPCAARLRSYRLAPILDALLAPVAVVRMPSRLRLASLTGLVLLTGLAFAEIVAWLGRAPLPRVLRTAALVGLAGSVALVAHHEYVHRFFPWMPASYPLRVAVSAESAFLPFLGDRGGAVLELPVAKGISARAAVHHARAMYRSIYHRRAIVNGYSSYWPQGFSERMKLAGRLPDHDALLALQRETGLEMILVHANELTRTSRSRWLAVIARGGNDDLALVARRDSDYLFRVRTPVP